MWTSSCTTVIITAATGGCVLTRNFSMGLNKLLSQSAYMVVFLMSDVPNDKLNNHLVNIQQHSI